MRHAMLNMTDEISKKSGKCSISRSDAFEGMYKTCGAAIGADTLFMHCTVLRLITHSLMRMLSKSRHDIDRFETMVCNQTPDASHHAHAPSRTA